MLIFDNRGAIIGGRARWHRGLDRIKNIMMDRTIRIHSIIFPVLVVQLH